MWLDQYEGWSVEWGIERNITDAKTMRERSNETRRHEAYFNTFEIFRESFGDSRPAKLAHSLQSEDNLETDCEGNEVLEAGS